MAEPSHQAVEEALSGLRDFYTGAFYGDTGVIRSLEVDSEAIRVTLHFGYPIEGLRDRLEQTVRDALAGFGVPLEVTLDWSVSAHEVQNNLETLAEVKNIVAVASGKGGVGKSTVAVNLALALAADGARVGLLDADIYGPSQPAMLGISGDSYPELTAEKRFKPLMAHGLQTMSLGYLMETDTPVVWRGPKVTGALQQLLSDTAWQALDYLIVDMPPGTGDAQLTLAQKVPVSGAVIVTTPQDIALRDARKGIEMFRKVSVPVLGVVENMAVHVCSHCGHSEHIFGEGGGERVAERYEVPLLGSLPLDAAIREQTDGGAPSVTAAPDSAPARAYLEAGRAMSAHLARRAKSPTSRFPKIHVQNT